MDKKIQKEIIKKLCELVEKCPDQRFGQMLYNYYLQYVNDEKDPFYVNDKKSLEILKKCVDNLPNQCYNKDVTKKGEIKMKIYKSWIFEVTSFGISDKPSYYFLSEEKAQLDNQQRLQELKEQNPRGWYENGVSTIEVQE